MTEEAICEECGNDLAAEGYPTCTECMELMDMAEESHSTGLPALVTLNDDGSIKVEVDLAELGAWKSYDDEVSDAWLERVEAAVKDGRVVLA